jgi:tetratricopeptide (TPR) repeat protein
MIGLEGAALAAFAQRDFEAASRWCAKLVEAHPDHFAAWFNSGVSLQRLGFYEQSADAYSRAAALDPQSAEAFAALGAVLQEREQWDRALEAYERALRLEPRSKTVLWNLALLHESRNRLEEAEKLYSKLVEYYPDAQEAWFRLGHAQLKRADFATCITSFQACLALPKGCPEALVNVGIAHWKMHKLDPAKDALRQAAACPATVCGALRLLAAIALEEQDYDQALKLHKQLLEVGGPTSELLYNLALLAQKRGGAADAVRYYRQALALRPDFPQALLNLGHALMTLGKLEEAQAAWQSALRGNVELAERFLV